MCTDCDTTKCNSPDIQKLLSFHTYARIATIVPVLFRSHSTPVHGLRHRSANCSLLSFHSHSTHVHRLRLFNARNSTAVYSSHSTPVHGLRQERIGHNDDTQPSHSTPVHGLRRHKNYETLVKTIALIPHLCTDCDPAKFVVFPYMSRL